MGVEDTEAKYQGPKITTLRGDDGENTRFIKKI